MGERRGRGAPPPVGRPPPAGCTSPAAERRDRLRVGLEGLRRRRWLLGARATPPPRPDPPASVYSAPLAPTSPLPGAVGQTFSFAAPSPRPGGEPTPAAAAGTGPPRPRRDSRPGRTVLSAPRRSAAPPGRRSAHVTKSTEAQGVCGDAGSPTRPVLKHGPRSPTRARVRGRTKPRGATKVRAGARRPRWDPGPLGAAGRTTGPSRPLCRGGGA